MRAAVLIVLVSMLGTVQGADRIQVHGHRGARAVLPENTLPAFEYAIQAGVDVLELDLSVTKDDVLMVSHDPHMNTDICSHPDPAWETKNSKDRAIRNLTYAQVREWDCGAKKNPGFPKQKPVPGTKMPTLEEVLRLAKKGYFLFNIETKISPMQPELTPSPKQFAELVLAAVRKYKLEDRVILQSFDFRTLHAMKKIAPEIKLSALDGFGQGPFPKVAERAKATIISPEKRLVTPEQVEAAHKAGLQVVPWTANEPAEWDKLVAAKVDAIITDDPAALIQYLKQKKLR